MSHDPVNHPTHYCVNGLECIDVIEALNLNYHFSNAFKYLWRAGRKDPVYQDIQKAVWYLNRWLEKNKPSNESNCSEEQQCMHANVKKGWIGK
jgi:hypothetical protein